MNLYAFSLLVFGIVSFSVGFQVLVRRKDKLGFLYFSLSLFYAWWGIFCALCISGIFPYSASLFLARFHNLGALFIPVSWLHFVLVYTNYKNLSCVKWTYLAPLLIGAFFNTDFFIPAIRATPQFPFYAVAGPLFYLSAALFSCLVPFSFYILMKDYLLAKGVDRSNKGIFIIVSLIGYVAGGFTFLPCFGFYFPQNCLVLMPLYPFGLAYFMTETGLLSVESFAQAAHKDKLAALGMVTASMNHEIRSPLFLMRGMIETEGKDSDLGKKLLSQINRVTEIVSRLTHFAKKGVDEEAKIEAIDLKEILSDIRPLFQHQLNYQNIEYTQDTPVDLPKVMADRRYLEEILFNLILNACQALKNTQSPTIKLSARILKDHRQQTKDNRLSDSLSPKSRGSSHSFGLQSSVFSPSEIEISISDNGPGIAPDQQKNIFKPFHTTKSEGTGLGLYITKQLVEKCGGKIEVQSELNTGAQFSVNLKAL